MNDITFYQRFEADILAGRKTITIRDKSESHFKPGDILRVGRFEDNQYLCTIIQRKIYFTELNFKLYMRRCRTADSSLNRISTILGILGGSLGLIATVVTAYDKVYVEPAQNISQINKSISTMKKILKLLSIE